LSKPGEEFTWKVDDRLSKPGDDFTWKGSERLAKPESLVKPIPASPGSDFFEAWPAKWIGPGREPLQQSKPEAIWKSEMQQGFKSQFLHQQQKMQEQNRQFSMVSNIMKTKHDTAKSAINNIR
jgi:hypothetical protein